MLNKNRQNNHAKNATSQEIDYISQTIIAMKVHFIFLETRLKNLQLSLEGLLSRNACKMLKNGVQYHGSKQKQKLTSWLLHIMLILLHIITNDLKT